MKMKTQHSYQDLWDTAKAALRGKFIATSAYIKKQKQTEMQTNKLITH
jgi:hypothetical protein